MNRWTDDELDRLTKYYRDEEDLTAAELAAEVKHMRAVVEAARRFINVTGDACDLNDAVQAWEAV